MIVYAYLMVFLMISPFLLIGLIWTICWLIKMERMKRRQILANMAKFATAVAVFFWLWQQPIFGGLTGEWRLVSNFGGGFGRHHQAPQIMRLNPDGTFPSQTQETTWVFSTCGSFGDVDELQFEPRFFGGGIRIKNHSHSFQANWLTLSWPG